MASSSVGHDRRIGSDVEDEPEVEGSRRRVTRGMTGGPKRTLFTSDTSTGIGAATGLDLSQLEREVITDHLCGEETKKDMLDAIKKDLRKLVDEIEADAWKYKKPQYKGP